MIGHLFRQQLEVRRGSPASPATVDAWNQPTYTADTTTLTVAGQIQPLNDREVAALTDAGAQIGDFKAYTLPADIRDGDRIRDEDGRTFEVRSSLDEAGVEHHRRLLLRLVTD